MSLRVTRGSCSNIDIGILNFWLGSGRLQDILLSTDPILRITDCVCAYHHHPCSLYCHPFPQPALSHSFWTIPGPVIKNHMVVFKLHCLDDSSSAAVACLKFRVLIKSMDSVGKKDPKGPDQTALTCTHTPNNLELHDISHMVWDILMQANCYNTVISIEYQKVNIFGFTGHRYFYQL